MTGAGRQLTLALDASAALGTVAVLDGARLLSEGETRMRGEAGERLLPTALDALRAVHATVHDVGDIVCGDGPGGFTGLRIAAGVAKGLCFARGTPLAVTSSLLLAFAASGRTPPPGKYLVALDALRGELFVLDVLVDAAGNVVPGVERRMSAEDARAMIAREGMSTVANASDVVAAPHARGVALLRTQSPASIRAVSLDDWEPAYGRKAEAQVKWEATHGRALT